MFTGLIEACGTICGIEPCGPGKRLTIAATRFFDRLSTGDSVAINGCCLTLVAGDRERASFEAGEETLRRTSLGQLAIGTTVNLERATCAGSPLGGHLVTGHIDGVGALSQRIESGAWADAWITVPEKLTRQMACKGSVAVDGVSLTLVDVRDNKFSVALIPHTMSVTTLGRLKIGDLVNVETDILAKYVERQLVTAGVIRPSGPN